MTLKKRFKKRQEAVEVSKVEEYYNVKLTNDGNPLKNEKEQIDSLKNVEKDLKKLIHQCSEIEIWNIVENRAIAESTKRKIQFRLKGFLEHYKLPCELFKTYLIKDKNGKYPNIPVKTSEPIEKATEKKSYR